MSEQWCRHKVPTPEGTRWVEEWVKPRIRKWESSIAVITDLECPKCGTVFDRNVEPKVSSHSTARGERE